MLVRKEWGARDTVGVSVFACVGNLLLLPLFAVGYLLYLLVNEHSHKSSGESSNHSACPGIESRNLSFAWRASLQLDPWCSLALSYI